MIYTGWSGLLFDRVHTPNFTQQCEGLSTTQAGQGKSSFDYNRGWSQLTTSKARLERRNSLPAPSNEPSFSSRLRSRFERRIIIGTFAGVLQFLSLLFDFCSPLTCLSCRGGGVANLPQTILAVYSNADLGLSPGKNQHSTILSLLSGMVITEIQISINQNHQGEKKFP